MISSPPSRNRSARGFTLAEVMVATAISVFVLAGVLTANLQVVRSSIRLTQYAEMDTEVRRALDQLSHDLKSATAITTNTSSDLTLTLPAAGGTTAQVTYAWSADTGTFFRVAGASSAVTTGRLDLVHGIAALPDGSAGLVFARFDRDGAATTSDAAARSIQITMTVKRTTRFMPSASQNSVSATYTLRSKA